MRYKTIKGWRVGYNRLKPKQCLIHNKEWDSRVIRGENGLVWDFMSEIELPKEVETYINKLLTDA